MNPADRHISRGRWCTAALAALALLVGGAATAQDEAAPLHPFSVKLGAFMPTQNHMKGLTSDTWWAFGVDWVPGLRMHPASSEIHIGADIVWHGLSGGSDNMTSLTGKLIWHLTPLGNRPRIWAGFGGGLYFINLPTLAGFPTIGAKFIAGVDITERIFFEADYDYVSGFTDNAGLGLRADGVTLAGGYRF